MIVSVAVFYDGSTQDPAEPEEADASQQEVTQRPPPATPCDPPPANPITLTGGKSEELRSTLGPYCEDTVLSIRGTAEGVQHTGGRAWIQMAITLDGEVCASDRDSTDTNSFRELSASCLHSLRQDEKVTVLLTPTDGLADITGTILTISVD
jgi:hypothetical protein